MLLASLFLAFIENRGYYTPRMGEHIPLRSRSPIMIWNLNRKYHALKMPGYGDLYTPTLNFGLYVTPINTEICCAGTIIYPHITLDQQGDCIAHCPSTPFPGGVYRLLRRHFSGRARSKLYRVCPHQSPEGISSGKKIGEFPSKKRLVTSLPQPNFPK